MWRGTNSSKFNYIFVVIIKNTIEYWKDKFDKLISFLYSKLHN